MAHICVNKLDVIGSSNGLSPVRRQAVVWINDDLLLIGPLEIIFGEIAIKITSTFIQEDAFENVVCETGLFCFGLIVFQACKFTALYGVLVPHKYFDNTQTACQALLGKTG